MKKAIAMILSAVLMLSCIGTLPTFAAEETVLLSEDFSTGTAGNKPGSLSTQENAATKVYAHCALDGDNMALYAYHEAGCDCGKTGSPSGRITVDIALYKKLTVSLKAKNGGANAFVQFYSAEPKATTNLISVDETKWTDVVITLDFEKMTFVSKVGGQEAKSGALQSVDTTSSCQLRFMASTPEPGTGAYFDDIKITGIPSEGNLAPKDDEPLPTEPDFAPTEQAKRANVPQSAYVIFDTDFNDALELSTAAKTKLVTPEGTISPFSSATAYGEIADVNKNRMLRFGALDGKAHSPRVEIKLPGMAKRYSFDYAIAFSGGNVQADIYADGAKINSGAIGKMSDTDDTWHYIHMEIDLKKRTVSGDVDGKSFSGITLGEIKDFETVKLRITAGLKANDMAYVDSMALYTEDEIKVEGMLMGNNRVAWENVKPAKPLSDKSFVNNLTPHPRVFVHDWDYMRVHVNDDHMTRMWYASLKNAADRALVTDFARYELNSRGNILDSARSARTRLVALAFTYKIEGDKKYLNRAYEEMLAYGKWPEWSAYTAMLATSEILQGYAYAYDWLYDDLTAEQRKTIMDILKKHALPVYIYQYEEHKGSVISTNNWNPDINATAIALALAIAEDEPNMAEYILEKAPPCITKYYAPAYAPQGAYPEGVSYWDLGTSFMLFATDFLENAFVEGFELPEDYLAWKAPGVAETPDFAIYYDGPVEKFNYGDCTSGHTNCVAMYWAANRFNKPHYAWWQNNRQMGTGSYLSSFDAVAALAWYDADNAYLTPGAFPLDKFYDAPGAVNGVSMRSSWQDNTALWGAMQGGNNGESHQHLSLGTYVIDYMGSRFIRVLGIHDYSLSGPLYYKRAEAYNNLVINPSPADDQLKSGNAQLIRHAASDNTAFGILDLTKTHANYVSAKRGLMLTENRNRIIVQDEVVAKKPSEFYWFANTDANVQIAPDGKRAMLTMNGERMLARIIEAPAEARFALMDRKSLSEGVDNFISDAGGKKLYLHFTDKTELNICVEYVPLREGEGIRAPWTYTKLDNWTANDNGMTASALSGANVILKIGSPNAFADGIRTFVDTKNTDVVPFTENGRTLVPVRFISEAFGAEVGWDDATQTVSVTHLDKEIELVIGSNEMKVNGETVLLDVPANTYNFRTLIPLRALVEALGKSVFWDDRGLIVIGDAMASYTEAELVKLIGALNVRVRIDGKDAAFFDLDRSEYAIDVKSGAAVPQIGISTVGTEVVSCTQAGAVGESATVTIDGKAYTFKLQPDAFENVIGSKDAGVITSVEAMSAGTRLPEHETFIYVEDLTDSTAFASYPERGIVDGVINESTLNRWASNEPNAWIQMDFGSVKTVHSMAFAGVTQTARAYKFDVLASIDGENYTTVHTGGAPTTTDKMSIIPLGDISARYIKLVGHGNNQNAWNTYAEVRFYESAAQQNEDASYWPSYFAEKEVKGSVGTSVRVLLSAKDAFKNSVTIRPDAEVTYTVADESIATVSADGVVSFIKAGTTTVTVTVTQDGFSVSATANITVE